MKYFAVLCLAALAVAKPQDYNQQYGSGPITTVTERTFTIRGDADKTSSYQGGYSSSSNYYGSQGYSAPAQQSAYSYETVATATAAPVSAAQYQAVNYAAAPAYSYAAAPAYSYAAAPAYGYAAAPAYAYQSYQYQPAVQVQAVAPVYQQTYASPAANYYGYQQQAYQGNYVAAAPAAATSSFSASTGAVSSGVSVDSSAYQGVNQAAAGETKIYKHVYAFAAPEEPATRARVSVQAPVNKRKHYKLVFIKAPSQQTVVDSDITLPAQEEEKTLIYVLSKNQKQVQPEIRIKQQQASTHSKPEVYFLKYKNEAEAQAIASGAISGQSANVPAEGEVISDGSVSILGQSSGSSSSSTYNTAVNTAAIAPAVSNVAYKAATFTNVAPAVSNVAYKTTTYSNAAPAFGNVAYKTSAFNNGAYNNGAYNTGATYNGQYQYYNKAVVATPAVSQYSVGTVGVLPSVTVAPAGRFAADSNLAYSGASYSSSEEPASVAIKVTTEPSVSYEASTSSSFSQA